MKTNCWEYLDCGRELSGSQVKESGVCPAVTYSAFHGTNGGYNGGRYCWEVAGTFPIGAIRCPQALVLENCSFCQFYKLVVEEEGKEFVV